MATTTLTTDQPPKGLSIHLGLNGVDPQHYGGWDGALAGAENDAWAMAALADDQGLQSTLLQGRRATRAALLTALRAGLKRLAPADLLFISFSGFGGRMPNVVGGETVDRQSLSWCLHDGQWLEPELWALLRRVPAGVRVLLVIDSSHSGTVTRAAPPALGASTGAPRIKLMPTAVSLRTYTGHKAFYDKLHKDLALAAAAAPAADPPTVVLRGAQDNQVAMDGAALGPFTARLLAVWQAGGFQGDHVRFHKQLVAGMPTTQTALLFTRGDAKTLLGQRPFTV